MEKLITKEQRQKYENMNLSDVIDDLFIKNNILVRNFDDEYLDLKLKLILEYLSDRKSNITEEEKQKRIKIGLDSDANNMVRGLRASKIW